MDVWQWKASRGGHLGFVDDQYFGAPRDMTPAEAAGQARYQAGYWNDPGRAFYIYNYKGQPPGGFKGPVEVRPLADRLAEDGQGARQISISIRIRSTMKDRNGGCSRTRSVPYSKELDDKIPVGTVMPGVLIMGNYEGDRAQMRGAAKWKDGYWTLEMSRDLKTGSKFDHDFVPGKRALHVAQRLRSHADAPHAASASGPYRRQGLVFTGGVVALCVVNLTINGKQIDASPGETLIDAALGGWMIIPHDCRSGQCESCRVTVVSGSVDDHGTSDGHTVLACQATVTGDASIEFDELPAPQKASGSVTEINPLSHDVVEVVVSMQSVLDYRPGQYVRLKFAGFPAREYSPTFRMDGTSRDDQMVFHVRCLPDGRVSSEIGRGDQAGPSRSRAGAVRTGLSAAKRRPARARFGRHRLGADLVARPRRARSISATAK